MNRTELLQNIQENITDNDNGLITAQVMRDVLGNIVNEDIALGLGDAADMPISQKAVTDLYNQGYKLVGTATPSTTPMEITAKDKVFYIAVEEGDYANYGVGYVTDVSIIRSDNARWKKEVIGGNFSLIKKVNYTFVGSESLPIGNEIKIGSLLCSLNGTASLLFYHVDSSGTTTNVQRLSPNSSLVITAEVNRVQRGGAGSMDVIINNIPNGVLDGSQIRDNSIPGVKLQEQYASLPIDLEDTSFYITKAISKNWYNPETSLTDNRQYININDGTVGTGYGKGVTDFIPMSTQGMTISKTTESGSIIGAALYDKNKQFISGSGVKWGKSMQYVEGAAYVRFSLPTDTTDLMVNEGLVSLPYEPFIGYKAYIAPSAIPQEFNADNLSKAVQPAISATGKDGVSLSQASLAANTKLRIDSYPIYVKKTGTVVGYFTFEGVFSGDVYVGFDGGVQGEYSANPGFFARVTDTEVIIEHKYANDGWGRRKNHELTFEKFIMLTYNRDNQGNVHIVLSTLGGQYVCTFTTIPALETHHRPFIQTTSMNITDVKLSAYNEDFRKPIWVIGDSYTWLANDTKRWTYVLQEEYGINQFLLQGKSGGTSSQLLDDLILSFNFGTPKYLIWCLGMNDSSLDIWLTTFNVLKNICANKGIELVLSTIPTTPTQDKEDITDYVRNSGYRYIDFYKAVGTNSSGAWYDGCLDDDNVHPTPKGSKALAARVLVDLPEIINFDE